MKRYPKAQKCKRSGVGKETLFQGLYYFLMTLSFPGCSFLWSIRRVENEELYRQHTKLFSNTICS